MSEWKRYSTPTGAHVTAKAPFRPGWREVKSPAVDVNGRPLPAVYPKQPPDAGAESAPETDTTEAPETDTTEAPEATTKAQKEARK